MLAQTPLCNGNQSTMMHRHVVVQAHPPRPRCPVACDFAQTPRTLCKVWWRRTSAPISLLAVTHFLASPDDPRRYSDIFDALSLQELESWFPDESGIFSQLPPTWTADLVGQSQHPNQHCGQLLPRQDLRWHTCFLLRCLMPRLLAPVVESWPHCAAHVRALSDSGQLQEHAQDFRNSRHGVCGRPEELLSGLLPPVQKNRQSRWPPGRVAPWAPAASRAKKHMFTYKYATLALQT